ncbi:hypothetical protein MVES_000725 [Malassezia vespertilionis]|uniref:L domain-like protein n=2 Tax=Malassezia vespertilionis TaxID=2020962 RepID=A0A2N1JGV1_9BASI|nr:hypothetical protein MVES_000725 [Malassezia vespertilionis]
MLQPPWKASPGKGKDRYAAMGGDMFSPMKLQQMFHSPGASAQTAFTFRAAHPQITSSTPIVSRPASQAQRTSSNSGPPSTPGGPHIPLRLFNLQYDARVRSGLEQLVEEHDVDLSHDASQVSEASTLQNMHASKRLRVGSLRETTQRIPMAYKGDKENAMATPRSKDAVSTPPIDVPRSILKSVQTKAPHIPSRVGRTPRSRSISFADQKDVHVTPRTARLEHVLAELDAMNLTRSAHGTPRAPNDASGASERSILTNASFQVARDKIVELLTDVAPWEPDWKHMARVDLRARKLESCIGLNEFLPNVREVWLDYNHVAFTTGLPSSVRVLSAVENRLSELASFSHLQQLEVLDIRGNELHSLQPLADLAALKELRADRNQITTLHGLEHLTNLQHLSVDENMLGGALDLGAFDWSLLETLRLGRNAITHLERLDTLAPCLRVLDMDENALAHLHVATMHKLHTLRLCGNARLRTLAMDAFPHLRTLYADRCSIARLDALDTAHALQRLSLRQQHVALHAPLRIPAKLQRLFLSGNALTDREIIAADAQSLLYLELAGCQLTVVPSRIQQQTPALRTLNLDHNHLQTLPKLAAWRHLKRLSCVGCQLPTLETLVHSIHGLEELCVLDTRMNPCTSGLYPPMLIPVQPAAEEDTLPPVPNPAIVQPDRADEEAKRADAEHSAAKALADRSQFHKRTILLPPEPRDAFHARDTALGSRAAALFASADKRFVATLPHTIAAKRVLYRGLCGMACDTLTWLDGLELTDTEVEHAADVLRRADLY